MAVLDFFYVLHIMFLSCLSILLYLALFFPPWIYIYIFFSSFDIPLSVSESASSIEIFNDLWLISLSLHLHTLYFGLLLTHIPTTFISDPGWFHVKCNCIIQEWLWYAPARKRERCTLETRGSRSSWYPFRTHRISQDLCFFYWSKKGYSLGITIIIL